MSMKKMSAFSSISFLVLLTAACTSTEKYSYDPQLPMSCRSVVELITEPSMIESSGDSVPEELRGKTRHEQRQLVEKNILSADKSAEDCNRLLERAIVKIDMAQIMPPVCTQYRSLFKDKVEGSQWDSSKTKRQQIKNDSDIYLLKSVKGEKTLKAYCSYALSVWQNEESVTQDTYRKGQQAYPLPQACEDKMSELEAAFLRSQTLFRLMMRSRWDL